MGKEVTAKLMNDICRCTGETEINGEVKVCPASNQCLRYLERETFRGRVYQYPIMTAPEIKSDGCSSMINRVDNKQISYQPKGSMCLACKHASRDCSGLAFNQMIVIENHEDLRIVKCRDFEKLIIEPELKK